MKHFVRIVLCTLTVAGILTGSAGAYACRQLNFEPRLTTSLAVLHLRVVEARIVRLEDIGVGCETRPYLGSCEMIEVRFDVIEAFKGPVGDLDAFYTDLPGRCDLSITIGQEYVFFLRAYAGLIEAQQGSFPVGGAVWQDELTQLKDWKLKQ